MNFRDVRYMKVLQMGKYYPPSIGGIETVMFDITEGLSLKGVSCDVLCSNDVNVTKYEKSALGYNITRAASFGKLASTSISPALIKESFKQLHNYDVIHIHLPDPMANLAVYLVRPEAKIVLHWHSDIIKQKQLLKVYAPLLNWLVKRANVIIATSLNYAESSFWLQKYSFKTKIVPIGIKDPLVESDSFSQADRLPKENVFSIKKSINDKIVFSLGRMSYYKGFGDLIEAAKFLPKNYKIVIGGTGELLQEYILKVKNHGLTDQVELIGKIEQSKLWDCYRACDVFCLPSVQRSEAFGVVLPEAMAFSKPILATNIIGSGTSWVNKHNFSGINVDPGNPSQLAEAIKLILSSEELIKKYSIGARSRFEDEFTRDKMVDKIIKVYSEII